MAASTNSEMIQGIVNTFNRHRASYPNANTQQTAKTHPLPPTGLGAEAVWNPPTESGQNLMSSTLTTQVGKKNSESESDSNSDD